MAKNNFDVLTWRKGTTEDPDPSLFTKASHTDAHGQTRTWEAADTAVEVPIGTTGEVFGMRQLSRQVNTPHHRNPLPGTDPILRFEIKTKETSLKN